MKNILIMAFITFVGWKFYTDSKVKISKPEKSQQAIQVTQAIQSPIDRAIEITQQPKYECDGRQYCSQMTSCAEAKYFVQHCPNIKMDGDGDGIPCERQWCR